MIEEEKVIIFSPRNIAKYTNAIKIPMESGMLGGKYLTVILCAGAELTKTHLALLRLSTHYYRDSNTNQYHFFSITEPPRDLIEAIKGV